MISASFILGGVAALFVGAVLGVLGAGGAILAVPALVYLFGVPARIATHLSLGIVGAVALLAMLDSLRSNEVNFKLALRFFIPSSFGVILARRFLIPALPAGSDLALMVLFAAVMGFAARAMLRTPSGAAEAHRQSSASATFWIRAGLVGVLTGLLGAGGGFLIVPILLSWGGLEFRSAVGTSLLVIFLNSSVGFISGWSPQAFDFLPLLSIFVSLSIMGMFFGKRWARHLPVPILRKSFAIFLLVVAAVTLLQEALS
ncbi:MAG: hypothetical protein RJB38_319 [Pseudomonadota bacterium]